MNQYLVIAIIDIVIGFLAFKNKNNPAARALSFTLLCGSLWSLELFLLSTMSSAESLFVPFHMLRWGMFFIPSSLAFFSWRLLGSGSRKVFFYVVVPGLIASGALCICNFFFFPSELQPKDSGFLPKVDTIYYLFAVNLFWCFGGSIWGSIAEYGNATVRQRQKVKWLLVTIMVCFSGVLVNTFLMPGSFYLSQYTGVISNIIGVFLLFYSAIQHDLMDLRSALSLSLSRLIMFAVVFLCVLVFLPLLGVENIAFGRVFAFSLAIVFMLEVYSRVVGWVFSKTKKVLVADSYDFGNVRAQCRIDLNECVSLEECIQVLDRYVLNFLSAEHYTMLLVENELSPKLFCFPTKTQRRNIKLANKNDIAIQYFNNTHYVCLTDETPLNLQAKLVSENIVASICVGQELEPMMVMMLGPPQKGGDYRYDDIKLLEFLQAELGVVLPRIYQLDNMQDQLGEAKKTLSMLGMMNHYHHDIKAPLAIIDGVLSNDIYDKDKQKEIVLKQVDRGSRLIATMASVLKGERKRTVQPLNIVELVKESVFLFSTGINDIEYHQQDVPRIQADAEDMKILVINVLKNAMEARRFDVPLNVSISTWQTDMKICLSIKDNGRGMSEYQLSGLWGGIISQGKKYGTGIGLQAIKRIADEHFAEIEVDSTEGVGTEFIVKFPRSIAVEEVYCKSSEILPESDDKLLIAEG